MNLFLIMFLRDIKIKQNLIYQIPDRNTCIFNSTHLYYRVVCQDKAIMRKDLTQNLVDLKWNHLKIGSTSNIMSQKCL